MLEQGHTGITAQMSELDRVRTLRHAQYLVGLHTKNCVNVRAL